MFAPEKRIIEEIEILVELCRNFRLEGKRISLTSGVFDILHPAHLLYLMKCRREGDVLVVGVDSDELTRRMKGEDRPILDQGIRSYLIAGFRCVDLVHIIDDADILIKEVKPDVLVISESTGKVESRNEHKDFVEGYGGRFVVFPPQSELHTTKIIEKMKS